MSVITHMTMSLDGFIAHPDDRIDGLFDWYDAGSQEVGTANPGIRFHLDEAGADMMRRLIGNAGALVCGRRLFDLTDGWGDRHPVGTPVVVVSHSVPDDADRRPRTTFAPDVATAVDRARAIAGPGDVVVSSADIARQALAAGLLDEIAVSLVPIVLGTGLPFFAGVAGGPFTLADPEVTPGLRATHLRYRVLRPA